MLADAFTLGHRRHGLGPQVLRVRRGVAEPTDPLDRVDRAQQVGELRAPLAGAEVPAVGVHVLAQQRQLGHAVAGEVGDLGDDVAHPPADLGAAHRGHDAERAAVVTADLDRDPGAVVDLPPSGQGRRVGLVLIEDLDDRDTGAVGLCEERRGVRQVVGAEHDVHVTGPLDDEIPVLLGQAPSDRDLQVRAGVLQGLEVPERPVELVVGVLADAAGVEDDHIGRSEIVGRFHALGREEAGDPLGIVLVHLAPEGAHVEAAGHDR